MSGEYKKFTVREHSINLYNTSGWAADESDL